MNKGAIDKYIVMASGLPDNTGMNSAVETLAKNMGIGRSTVFRWKRLERIDSAADMMKVALLINKYRPDSKISIKDLVLMSGLSKEIQ